MIRSISLGPRSMVFHPHYPTQWSLQLRGKSQHRGGGSPEDTFNVYRLYRNSRWQLSGESSYFQDKKSPSLYKKRRNRSEDQLKGRTRLVWIMENPCIRVLNRDITRPFGTVKYGETKIY